MIRAARRIAVLTVCLAFSAFVAAGQDLGSANKLFKPKTPAKTQKPPAKPAADKKPVSKAAASKKTGRTPKRTPARTTTAKAKPVPKKPAAKKDTAVENDGRFSAFRDTSAKKPDDRTKRPRTAEPDAATVRRYSDLIEQGNLARDRREYATAERSYKSASTLIATDARAVYGLGNLYSDQHRWEESEAAYRRALEIDDTSGLTFIALSYVLTQPLAVEDLGDRYAEAEKFARRAIQLMPSNALAHDQLGVALELRGLIDAETENAYRRAIRLDPSFAPAHAHLGRLLRRRGMTREAEAAYHEAISLARDAASRMIVAEVMQSDQRFMESEPLLRSALADDPRNPAALLMLGRALTAQGQYAEAEQVLRMALNASANGFMANSMLGSMYSRQGRLEQAEGSLLQAVRFASPLERRQLARQFKAVGDGYRRAGKTANAERAYRQASQLEAQKDPTRSDQPKGVASR